MLWLSFALLAALCESLKDLFSKLGLHYTHPHIAALAASTLALPILLSFFLLTSELPLIGPHYWEALLLGGILNVLAFVQFMRALQASDLSLTIPFITFTPIFLLFTSPWMVGELPGFLGFLGILLIVSGSYCKLPPNTDRPKVELSGRMIPGGSHENESIQRKPDYRYLETGG